MDRRCFVGQKLVMVSIDMIELAAAERGFAPCVPLVNYIHAAAPFVALIYATTLYYACTRDMRDTSCDLYNKAIKATHGPWIVFCVC